MTMLSYVGIFFALCTSSDCQLSTTVKIKSLSPTVLEKCFDINSDGRPDIGSTEGRTDGTILLLYPPGVIIKQFTRWWSLHIGKGWICSVSLQTMLFCLVAQTWIHIFRKKGDVDYAIFSCVDDGFPVDVWLQVYHVDTIKYLVWNKCRLYDKIQHNWIL